VSGHSPATVEDQGRRLADAMREQAPTVIVIWRSVESALLGHVVARELEADLTYVIDDLGVLSFEDPVSPHASVGLVSVDWTEAHGLAPLIRMVQAAGARIVGVGSVLPGPVVDEAADLEVHTLEELSG